MRGGAGTDRSSPLRGLTLGRLVPSIRGRAVGRETGVAVGRPGGGLQVSVETELAFGEAGLRQSVAAIYDAMLRPEHCSVEATIDSRRMRIEVAVGAREAVVRVGTPSGDEERTIPLGGEPLLLIDNCFTLHALASWRALHGDSAGRNGRGEDAIHTALPIGREVRANCRGRERVSLGGVDLGIPSVTLHLAPELDEHAWFVDNRLERLAIPRLHVRVDRIDAWTFNGEGECKKR